VSAITADIGAQYRTAILEAAVAAIEAAKVEGLISDHGYGEPDNGYYRRGGERVSNQHFNIAEVATSLLYLTVGPVVILKKVSRDASTSYGWKHQAENWGELAGFSPYVSNGAFIVAADWVGVPSVRERNSPNIAYALRSLRDLQNWEGRVNIGKDDARRKSRYETARMFRKVVD
jgi:hypothetical protein